jgi:hypothetical protein
MRIGTPPMAPKLTDNVTVHIVLNDFGKLGRAYVETDEAEADERTVVEDILSGQYSHPIRVVAFNTAEGWARTRRQKFALAYRDVGTCAANTNFGQCGRRFHRYPNRRVATSAWPLNRRHSRRGHVGNPITNEGK